MASDPRKLRPSELVRMLNSTPRGQVVTDRQLYLHRQRAGFKIGDGKTVDLLRYAAWLVDVVEAGSAPSTDDAERYEAHKRRMAKKQADQAAAGQEIGPIPAVANLDRRRRATESLRAFYEIYFPKVFYHGWSQDHLRAIKKIERAVREGGLFALAMPRGSGKSAMIRTAALWAILTGMRRFVVLVGATSAKGIAELKKLQIACETNQELAADWPDALYPVVKLGRIVNRQKGQKHNGEPTYLEWQHDTMVMPSVRVDPAYDKFDGTPTASGSVIFATGLGGSDVRGPSLLTPAGEQLRPDFVMVDDPQTTESAWSIEQCDRRLGLINGDVLGLAGPGEEISVFLCCTVIRPGDVADTMLNRQDNPEWQGERNKLLYVMPTNEALWDQYAQVRADGFRSDSSSPEAACNAFYAVHRAKCGSDLSQPRACSSCSHNATCMDAGAVVAWPQRYKRRTEISALQHAMNLKFRDEAAFFAEFQNDPILQAADAASLTAAHVSAKASGYKRGEVPAACNHLTAFVDVHKEILFYLVAAWQDDFTGCIIDYGTMPDQRGRDFFTVENIKATLGRTYQGHGMEAAVQAGIESVGAELLSRQFLREDGAIMHIERLLIDSGWGQCQDQVFAAIVKMNSAVLMPSKGVGLRAGDKPFSDYKRMPGERYGWHWRIPSPRRKRELMTLHIDTNYWKSFVHARLAVPRGDPGCLSLFGSPADHRLLAEHLTSEASTRTEGRGRVVDDWKPKPGTMGNHWLDCLVGCAAAASMLEGVGLPGMVQIGQRQVRKKVRLSALQRSA